MPSPWISDAQPSALTSHRADLSLQSLLLFALVNAAAFVALGWDKRCATVGDRRIPERTLLGLAAIGGSLGAVAAQQLFRHKTRKEPFRTLLWLILAAQSVALLVWMQR
jgi:uncharacterized membrane protein YsdA (DUF1294 family)